MENNKCNCCPCACFRSCSECKTQTEAVNQPEDGFSWHQFTKWVQVLGALMIVGTIGNLLGVNNVEQPVSNGIGQVEESILDDSRYLGIDDLQVETVRE